MVGFRRSSKALRGNFFEHFASLCAAALLLFANCSSPVENRQRPNIIWIIAEDMSPDLGCYGDPLVQSPALDRMASEGIRYTSAFTPAPVCSSSRSALITGMYQTTIGAHHHRSHHRDGYRLPEGVEAVTNHFRRAGYFTANVTTPAPGLKGTGKNDFNFQLDNPYDGTDWSQRAPGQPFFAQINFSEVHRPYRKALENPVDPDRVVLPPYYPNEPIIRNDWALYLDTIGSLDKKVDAVLKRLDGEGLRQTTVVFFFSDHGAGQMRGKHSLYDGGISIPLIVRWPHQIKPGTVSDQLISIIDITATSLVLAGIELPLKMQGRPFLGANVEPREFIFAARDRIDEAEARIRAVRTRRFKYIRDFFPDRPYPTQWLSYKDESWPVLGLMRQLYEEGKLTPEQAQFMAPQWPPEGFYDLEQDPYELENLVDSSEHRQILEDLRAQLDTWIEETGDLGVIPEDPQVVAYWRQWMVDRYEKAQQPGGHGSPIPWSSIR